MAYLPRTKYLNGMSISYNTLVCLCNTVLEVDLEEMGAIFTAVNAS